MATYATTALEVVSLEEIKDELRLGSDESQDAMITAQVEAAVSWLEKYIGRSIVQATVGTRSMVKFFPLTNDRPISFIAKDFISLTSSEYWPLTAHITDEPIAIDADDLGPIRRSNWMWHNSSGPVRLWNQFLKDTSTIWPGEILQDTDIVITYLSGIDLDVAQALKQSVIVLVRQFYDGYAELRPNHAVMSLARPFQNWNDIYYD